ncbi:TPA: cell division protein FtsH [Patescibacteria group bacterium]|uniref:ATP-dependent zinc metalloprotease FtsH n=1 Tax=Candidatus Gottesmanbacteria bacterium GW2011_GWA1_43_11 TaxID=1618436 RepID=A0A0G1CL10_9BACT|nr:MAG: ATP-dependent zinc metalloprotease FtsH [Candidatus Gottesmanbacteria bacterium GW2011_GWA1_43_11]HCS78798.1 cell division protein FtsH [Patescibacteria group bacterium]
METEKKIPATKNKKLKKFELRLNFSTRTLFLAVFVGFLLLSFALSLSQSSSMIKEKPLSEVLTDVEAGKVAKIEVEEMRLVVSYTDGTEAMARKEAQESIYQLFDAAKIDASKVELEIKDTSLGQLGISLLTNVLPLILMVVFFLFLIRQARGAQDSIFSFGQSRAKLFNKDHPQITFANVAGVNEAKAELEEIVDFLKHPGKYRALGARTPKGVILVGPAGTGKTLLARAVAGEANVPFFSIAGSEFMEMLVGVGAARVRDLFLTAKKSSPAIIFIDEIDAIGRMRSVGVMGGHDEREQTLNQILVEMDGFQPNEQVVVIAATNRGDLLDPALLRPGRFDRRVVLDMPDIEGRKAILTIHMKGKPFDKNVDWNRTARRTVGFSGADLENMLNEAAIAAARHDQKAISMDDLEEAATKVKLGPEKKRLQSELDRKMTAYHEAGHAIVTYQLPHLDPVHRISIVSRGMALGFTLIPPAKDRVHETRTRLINQIASMLGGRAAEDLIFNELTTGASNDIDKATSIARQMVIEFGMSAIGPVNFGPQMDIIPGGKMVYEQPAISPEMLSKIDSEVQKILDTGYKTALATLKKVRAKLDAVAEALIKKETLEGDEFERIMGGPRPAVLPHPANS